MSKTPFDHLPLPKNLASELRHAGQRLDIGDRHATQFLHEARAARVSQEALDAILAAVAGKPAEDAFLIGSKTARQHGLTQQQIDALGQAFRNARATEARAADAARRDAKLTEMAQMLATMTNDRRYGHDAAYTEAVETRRRQFAEVAGDTAAARVQPAARAVDDAGRRILSQAELTSLQADKRFGTDRAYTQQVQDEYSRAFPGETTVEAE